MNPGETSRLIAETGVVPTKSKGQNFLTDGRVADRHIGYAEIEPGDRILEVGPGLGILTQRLIGKGVPFPPFDRFVSNLPYSVSTPIIFKLLEYPFKKAVVMVQKEFAERMVADVGSPDYSRLTVNLFYKAECQIVENVPKSRFKPQPKVDSCLVSITPRPAPFAVKDEKIFFRVTQVCFDHRRKKIGTSLKAARLIESADQIPYADERIEHLRPVEIGEIADAVASLKENL